MKNQRAIVRTFGGPDVIEVIEDDLPQPRPGEVRIRVEASSVLATDTLIRKGLYPLLKDQPPFALGYDVVGIVDALGEGVSNWRVGQRVADLPQIGGNARYLCRPAEGLWLVPDAVDAADAVCLVLSGLTAYQMLKSIVPTGSTSDSKRVLVQGGSGAVGTLLLQLGRLMGLDMIATASAAKQQLLHDYGAIAIDYRADDYEQQLLQAAGTGFDAVFDAVGLSSFRRSYRLLKPNGTLITYGMLALAQTIPKRTIWHRLHFGFHYAIWMITLWFWNARPGSRTARFFGIADSLRYYPAQFTDDLAHLFSLLQSKQLRPLVFERLPLTDARRAHELLEEGHVCGQLVLVMDSCEHN